MLSWCGKDSEKKKLMRSSGVLRSLMKHFLFWQYMVKASLIFCAYLLGMGDDDDHNDKEEKEDVVRFVFC